MVNTHSVGIIIVCCSHGECMTPANAPKNDRSDGGSELT